MAKINIKDYEESIKNYANDIETIDTFVEAVRKLPGMYIGAIGNQGYLNCIREIFQNAVDEMMRENSPCHYIHILYDERNHSVQISDTGKGIPHGHIIRIFSSQHTSSNYTKKPGEYTSGINGVGSGVALALSRYFNVASYILGKAKQVEFIEGIAWDKGEVEIPCPKDRQGTTIKFEPAEQVLGPITLTCEEVFNLVAGILPLTNINDRIDFVGINGSGDVCIDQKMVNTEGIITDLIVKTSTPLIPPILFSGDTGITKAEIAFTYDSDDINSAEDITSYSNFCPTTSGTHENGFMDGLCYFFRTYMNKIYLNGKNKLTVINNDIKSGLKAVVVAAHLNPVFVGQSKTSLTNEDMFTFVSTLTRNSLEEWSKTHPSDLQKLCKYFKEIAEIRAKSEDNKIKLSTKYKSSVLSKGMPAKFVNPSGNKNLELIIVEGDSALGSAKTSRDSNCQGLYPIRGKIPNAFAKSKTEFLSNEEIASMITIIGGSYGKNFDIDKVRWEKVITMADADPDGSHINSLLLRFFLLYMPELITAGRLYKSVPPLYGISVGKKTKYFTNNNDFTGYVQNIFCKNNTIASLTNEKLTKMQLNELFINNIDYIYEMNKLSNTFAINPYVLEQILFMLKENNTISDFKQFKEKIERLYRFVKVYINNGVIMVEGLVDSKYQYVFLNDNFINSCQTVLDILRNNNSLLYYNLNSETVSLYKLMSLFEKSSPKGITRFKGLGEQDPRQLAESALLPDSNRTLIRYTMESAKEEINRIRYLDSNMALLFDNYKVTRQDLE